MWTGLQAQVEPMVQAMFKASVRIVLGNGESVLFWTDAWHVGGELQSQFPHLAAVIPKRIRKRRTVLEAVTNSQWVRDIADGLLVSVILEYLKLWEIIQSLHLQQDRQDQFLWKWTAGGTFSTSSCYRAFFHGRTQLWGARELWKVKAPGKCKFFAWLVLHGRCWTSARLKRHNLTNDDACAFCDQAPESVDHLFMSCPYSSEVWWRVLRRAGL